MIRFKFDYQTASRIATGRKIDRDSLVNFVRFARWLYEDHEILSRIISELRREIKLRENEIAMLKRLLMDYEHDAAKNPD